MNGSRYAPRPPGRLRRIAALAVVALLVLASRPAVALAHAYLLRAEPGIGAVVPRAPDALHLWFSEPIDLAPTSLELFGPNGLRIPVLSIAVDPNDATEMVGRVHLTRRGTYTVRWKAISADTHPVWGEFTFSVGHPSPIVLPIAGAPVLFQDTALAVQALARLLNLLSLALLVGPPVLWARILAPVARRDAPLIMMGLWQRTTRLYGWGLALLMAAVPLTLAAQMMSVSDSPSSAISLDAFAAALSGRLGLLLVMRLLLGLVLFVAGALLAYLGPGRLLGATGLGVRPALHPVLRLQMAVAGVLVLLVALGGHAAVTAPVPLSLLLDCLHIVAMALWVGGLCGLVGVLAPALRPLEWEQRRAVLAAVIPPFSALSLVCIATLTLTGLYSAVLNLAGPLDLLTTGYGRVLGLKLLVSVAILLVAAVNLLVMRPALARAGTGQARPVDLWAPLRSLLRAEAALAVAVLIIVGLLTALPPARQPGAGVGAGTSASTGEIGAALPRHARAAIASRRRGILFRARQH